MICILSNYVTTTVELSLEDASEKRWLIPNAKYTSAGRYGHQTYWTYYKLKTSCSEQK